MSLLGKRYIAIIGATASGKSALAIRLAHALEGELVNCDSIQFYRGFDIGSAKPDATEQAQVPHHLWDILNWSDEFDARVFADRADLVVEQIRARRHQPILVGGTGLYLRALWQEKWHELPKSESLRQELARWSLEQLWDQLLKLDPIRAQELHPNDRYRIQRAVEIAQLLGHPVSELPASPSKRSEAFVIRVNCPRARLHQRILERTRIMLNSGFLEEVERLLAEGVPATCKPMQSIGYKEVVSYLQGNMSWEDLEQAIATATRQYAKRQETWFRNVAADASWQEGDDFEQLVSQIR